VAKESGANTHTWRTPISIANQEHLDRDARTQLTELLYRALIKLTILSDNGLRKFYVDGFIFLDPPADDGSVRMVNNKKLHVSGDHGCRDHNHVHV